jgi:squalene synthase HpnC
MGSVDLTSARYLRDRRHSENFPVALRVLPKEPRTHLAAVYDVARIIDDLGDAAAGDRAAALRAFQADLERIWTGGRPEMPVLQRLAPTVVACHLAAQPFLDLISANLVDQRTTRYPRYADLARYCALSANPIGRLVLDIFGAATTQRVAWSDDVCTALQIIEHCQDVVEDYRAGRVYLPQEDLARFGVRDIDLAGPATPAIRGLIAYQLDRTDRLLAAGDPLVGSLRGWARLAVAGYVAGGRAAAQAIRRAHCDVMSGNTATSRREVARQAGVLLLHRRKGAP